MEEDRTSQSALAAPRAMLRGGAPEQREEIAAVGLVAHGPQVVDAGLEEGGITGLLHRCRRVEGEVLGLSHAGDPTGGDDGA